MDAMTIRTQLLNIIAHNNTRLEQFEALYELRNLINDTEAFDIFLVIELLLHDNEESLLEVDKDYMRKQLYQFPEDLDNVAELFRGLKGED